MTDDLIDRWRAADREERRAMVEAAITAWQYATRRRATVMEVEAVRLRAYAASQELAVRSIMDGVVMSLEDDRHGWLAATKLTIADRHCQEQHRVAYNKRLLLDSLLALWLTDECGGEE